AARFRRRGWNKRDAELIERPPDLGRGLAIHALARAFGDPVVRAAIGIERAEQTLLLDHLQERLEARHRAFLFDKERRVDLAGGVVESDDQVPLLILDPRMP